jgi:hypothetical protein
VEGMEMTELVGGWAKKLRITKGTDKFTKHIVDENGDMVAYVYVHDTYNVMFERGIKQVGVWSFYLDPNTVILPKIKKDNRDEVREELSKYFAPKVVDKIFEVADKMFERWGE